MKTKNTASETGILKKFAGNTFMGLSFHQIKRFGNKISVLLFWFYLSSAAALEVRYTDTAPRIDGNLSDPAWKKGVVSKLTGLGKTSIKNDTEMIALYDTENLYVAFKCYEKNMDKLKCVWNSDEAHDLPLWEDDCVEILLNPLSGGNSYGHIIINSAGRVYDAFSQKGISWESEAKCAVAKQDK